MARPSVSPSICSSAGSARRCGPVYELGCTMFAALGANKAHVNLIVAGPPGAFDDPDGRLDGSGKTGRHLKLKSLDDVPRARVRDWLKTAAHLARTK